MGQDDLYGVLGVSRTVSPDDLRSAYRRRAFETHPDRCSDPAEFLAVASAYRQLSDPELRAAYDAEHPPTAIVLARPHARPAASHARAPSPGSPPVHGSNAGGADGAQDTRDGPPERARRVPRRRPWSGFTLGLAACAGLSAAAVLGYSLRDARPAASETAPRPATPASAPAPLAATSPPPPAALTAEPAADPARSATAPQPTRRPPARRTPPSAARQAPQPAGDEDGAQLDVERSEVQRAWKEFAAEAAALRAERAEVEAAAARLGAGSTEVDLAAVRRAEATFKVKLATARGHESALQRRTAELNERLQRYNARVLASRYGKP